MITGVETGIDDAQQSPADSATLFTMLAARTDRVWRIAQRLDLADLSLNWFDSDRQSNVHRLVLNDDSRIARHRAASSRIVAEILIKFVNSFRLRWRSTVDLASNGWNWSDHSYRRVNMVFTLGLRHTFCIFGNAGWLWYNFW